MDDGGENLMVSGLSFSLHPHVADQLVAEYLALGRDTFHVEEDVVEPD